MTSEVIMAKTKAMIDDLKTVCANYGLGNASSEYKIITEVFLYKFLNDKFLHEIRKVDDKLQNVENIEETLTNMDDDEYEFLLASLPPATAQLKKEHFISFLFNNKNRENLKKYRILSVHSLMVKKKTISVFLLIMNRLNRRNFLFQQDSILK